MYCMVLFFYELTLLITGFLHIGNHMVANINTLLYTIVTLVLIGQIYKRYHQKAGSLKILIITCILVLLVGWIVENFFFGNSVTIYNSVLPGITSVIICLISIYLINVVIFAKSGEILKDPDVLIIAGLLIRSITFGFSLWFLNFDYGFDWNFLSNLLTGINVGLCLSDLFFLLAVQRIIGSAKTIVTVPK